jgi:hypothetical protein
MSSSYKPFLISETKTGISQYLEPWVRPNEAFDPMDNAYVYRGTLNKRNGYTILGSMVYRDNGVTIATGTGASTYSSTILVTPIRSSSVIINSYDVSTSSYVVLTDNGSGGFTGDGTGSINYTTGVVIASFTSIISSPVAITASYTYTPNQLTAPASSPTIIMGLKQWSDEVNGVNELLAFDTNRASLYNNTTKVFDPLYAFDQTLYSQTNTTTSPVLVSKLINTGWADVAPYSVSLTDGTVTIKDDGTGSFPDTSPFSSCTITYATGAVSFNYILPASAPSTLTVSANLQGDYFSGSLSDFFNSTNWLGNLYVTNNVDRITLYDGTDLSRPAFPITQAHLDDYTNDIDTCLDLDVYKNRLLVQKPKIASITKQQSIRWSKLNNPTNLVEDIAGNGGELSAPTDDFIASSEFLRDTLLVFFKNSTWTFRFTGDANNPFVFQKINNTKSTSAPYGTVPYDERITAMGNKGLIACDGTNVQRYDIPIIDQFIDNINQKKFNQCFAQRFDTLNQTWMLYPSDDALTISDSALIYNFMENTWATYSLRMSCLGLFYQIDDKTWAQMTQSWQSTQVPWNFYLNQKFAPNLVGGDDLGKIYTLDSGETDNGNTIESYIESTQWNPFVGTGEKVQFGYIDFYYEVNPETSIDLTFYVNDSEDVATSRTLKLDNPVILGSSGSDLKAWKRIFINCIGEFLLMGMDSKNQSGFKIIGMILWARPSGRLTQ